LNGDPLKQIVRVSRDFCVDLMIVCRVQHSFLRWLSGSFCLRLARRVGCRTIISEDNKPASTYAQNPLVTGVRADRTASLI
jgi:hypothetical protein